MIPIFEVPVTVSVISDLYWFLLRMSVSLAQIWMLWTSTWPQPLQPSQRRLRMKDIRSGNCCSWWLPSHIVVQSPVRKQLREVWNLDPILSTSAPPLKDAKCGGRWEWRTLLGNMEPTLTHAHQAMIPPKGSNTVSWVPRAGDTFTWAWVEQGRSEIRLQGWQACHLTEQHSVCSCNFSKFICMLF